ncbi:MAG TPA: outer membrane protein assembly factor BamD [Chthoniobacterales bacterium]|nr:outer membrane protein assembly factor BamD [Chthoniobacterales bacterium]
MKSSFRTIFLSLLIALAWPGGSEAAVIFKPKENIRTRAPGEEEVSGNAQQLFERAQEAERRGNIPAAIKAYRTIVKRYPKDTLAPGSCFRLGQLNEQIHKYLLAAQSYGQVCDKYPKSERFDESIEGMFRIGEMYLMGQKTKILGITVKSGTEQAAQIFAMIIRTAPYGKYTARAQFDLGRVREKQGRNEAAIAAYQAVVEKFPNDPIAVDAQYQIGYIWSKASSSGTYDPAAANNAKTAFEDFLARYPNSEKSRQAKQNLNQMEHKQTSTAYDIAKFYDKQKQYRAAAIYYNEVIRQQPGSAEGEKAKKRISELRAKVGDAKLQPPAVTAAAADKKRKRPRSSRDNSPPPPSSNEMAPLPPADTDASLPPPASLLPDSTTAPPSSSESTPSPSATPESSTPESTATP